MGRILDFVELVGTEWGLPDLPVPTWAQPRFS